MSFMTKAYWAAIGRKSFEKWNWLGGHSGPHVWGRR
jgi:hypothetical protein